MAAVTAAVAGTAIAGYGAYKGAKEQKAARQGAQQASADAQGYLSNVGANTPFGSASFQNGQLTSGLGQFGNMFGGLGQMAEQSFFNPQSLPGFLTGAAQGSFYDLGNPFGGPSMAAGGFNYPQGPAFDNPSIPATTSQPVGYTGAGLPPQMRAQYGLDAAMGRSDPMNMFGRAMLDRFAQVDPRAKAMMGRMQNSPPAQGQQAPTDFGGPTSMGGAANQNISLYAPGGPQGSDAQLPSPGGPGSIINPSQLGLPVGGPEVAAAQGAVGGPQGFNFNPTANQITAPGAAGQTAIQAAAEQGALDQFGVLNQDPAQIGADRLDILRQLAAPEEQRARVNMQDNLFAQGRLGTTGGGIQQEALARAQSDADLKRMLAAQDFGRQVQGDALNRFGTFAGEGRNQGMFSEDLINQNFNRQLNATQTNESLLNNDFARQMQQAGFSADETDRFFNRQLGASQFGVNTGFGNVDRTLDAQNQLFSQGLAGMGLQDQLLTSALGRDVTRSNTAASRALERFGLAGQLFDMGRTQRADEFNRGISSLGALGSLQGMGLNNFNAALNAAIAQSNAAVGAGSNMAQIASTTPAGVQLASGIFTGLGNAGAYDNIFKRG